MLILSIDTSGRQGSLALSEATTAEFTLLEQIALPGGRYSEELLPSIAALLARHGRSKSQLELIALANGPGSFTGLRVAVATAKGLAEGSSTPVVAVSVLEALADAVPAEGEVAVVLDAQRSELFFGRYRHSAGLLPERIEEDIAALAPFLAAHPGIREISTPDDTLALRLEEAGLTVHRVTRPDAAAIAALAHRKFLAGGADDLAALDCNYLRRSDAELFALPRLSTPGV